MLQNDGAVRLRGDGRPPSFGSRHPPYGTSPAAGPPPPRSSVSRAGFTFGAVPSRSDGFSPPARVTSALKNAGLVPSFRNRTDPSAIRTCAPRGPAPPAPATNGLRAASESSTPTTVAPPPAIQGRGSPGGAWIR